MSEERRNRSQLKREVLALQKLGEQLIALNPDQLSTMPLDEALLQAVLDAQRFSSFGARRRQVLFVGGLLRTIDTTQIVQALQNYQQGRAEGARVFHRIERWRDALIDGDDELLAKICADFPGADHQRLNQLLRNARKEREQNKDKKSTRALFRFLRDMVDAGHTE